MEKEEYKELEQKKGEEGRRGLEGGVETDMAWRGRRKNGQEKEYMK